MKKIAVAIVLLMLGAVLPMAAQSTYSQTNLPCYAWGCMGATFTDGSMLNYSVSGIGNTLSGSATLNGTTFYDVTGTYQYDPSVRPTNCVVARSIYNCYHIQFSFDAGKYTVDEWIQLTGTRTPKQQNVDGSLTY